MGVALLLQNKHSEDQGMAIKIKGAPAREDLAREDIVPETGTCGEKADGGEKAGGRSKSREPAEPKAAASDGVTRSAPARRFLTNLWRRKTEVAGRLLSEKAADAKTEAPDADSGDDLIPQDDWREQETPKVEEVDRSKLGWHSPSYSNSRPIALSQETLHANRCIAFDGDAATIDSYKVLRTQILQLMNRSGGNTIMVTSTLPGEGKTTTAINLAFIMAKEFQQTVLLVDCDLQQQSIHKYLGYPSDKGLINYLLDDCPVNELFTWPGIEKITLISGGRTIRDSSELLGSPRMKELVADMKGRYPNRFVIFDMQSTFAGADSLVFAPLVDNILMVVQEGKSSAQDIKRAISLLPTDKLLGVMLNRHKKDKQWAGSSRQDGRRR
jgi:non-specific protein-tyrosine kinase